MEHHNTPPSRREVRYESNASPQPVLGRTPNMTEDGSGTSELKRLPKPLVSPPRPPPAQLAQDQADDKARKKAAKDITQSWMDRLQLISVITTFFASTEAGMLQVITDGTTVAGQVANSAFLAALVLHSWAAIISFLGAFFLVRFNLKEAKEEELEVGFAPGPDGYDHPISSQQSSVDHLKLQPVWTTNPHVEQVSRFKNLKPPTHLLGRCHSLCMLFTFAGFGLDLLGILAFAWGQNPVSVGVVTSISSLVCFLGGAWVFI